MSQKLRIRLRYQIVSLSEQHLRKLAAVLDDPVVNYRHRAGAIKVGMGVGLHWSAMGRPTRVADACEHTSRSCGGELAEIVERPGSGRRPCPPQILPSLYCDPSRVVPPVLQACQTVE